MSTSRTPRRTGAGAATGAGGEAAAVRRWSMLGASTLAQAAAAVMVHGPAFLIPVLHEREGLTLAGAGLVAAAPTVGVMLTLVAWGAVTDRRGERFVLVTGLVATTAAGLLAALVGGTVPLALGPAAGRCAPRPAPTRPAAGSSSAGSRPQRRGLAMGIRQMAQPVGVGLAAREHRRWSPTGTASRAALWVPGGRLRGVRGGRGRGRRSTRPGRRAPASTAANPYRARPVPAPGPRGVGAAGGAAVPRLDLRAGLAGAGPRLVARRGRRPGRRRPGRRARSAGSPPATSPTWSASRMRPLRWVALAAAATMALLGPRGRAGPAARRRADGAWPRCSPSPTTGWRSPRSPSAPGRSGPGAPSASRTPRSSSPPRAVPAARRAADRDRGVRRGVRGRGAPSRCSPRRWCRWATSTARDERRAHPRGTGQRRADVRTVGT